MELLNGIVAKRGLFCHHKSECSWNDEWFLWKCIARFFGYFCFGLGTVILMLILYAMITRLAR
jgi:hypothetical protein